jgi:hypothetical protein
MLVLRTAQTNSEADKSLNYPRDLVANLTRIVPHSVGCEIGPIYAE